MKLTQNEINEIKTARYSGLVDVYLSDGYVYYCNGNGEGMPWHGFSGNLASDLPYHICTVHTSGYFGEDEEWGSDFGGEDGTDDGYFDNGNNLGGWG